MEQNGIGTDASMAQHINNICERNYVKVVGNTRKLVPTDLGSALIHSYQQIDEDLVAPNLRSEIEKRVDMIAKVFISKSKHLLINDYRDKLTMIKFFKKFFLFLVKNSPTSNRMLPKWILFSARYLGHLKMLFQKLHRSQHVDNAKTPFYLSKATTNYNVKLAIIL